MTESETKLARSAMWQKTTDGLSLEQVELHRRGNAFCISGMMLGVHEGNPLHVEYRVDCDEGWQTRHVQIQQCLSGSWTTLCLSFDGHGNWRRNGHRDQSLAGCTDVDLGITPSTNTLPIRRLTMGTGETRGIQAAWVRFPDLVVVPTHQSYHRVSAREYKYLNCDTGFTTWITMDEYGLVEDYGGAWTRVAQGPAAPEKYGFAEALISRASSPELSGAAEALNWLVGGWSAEVRDFDENGGVRAGAGEWWFSWILEGRALQDVFIVPSRALRSNVNGESNRSGAPNNRYGTTVRWFEHKSGQWRIVWVNPVRGVLNHLAGKREGDRIVLEGEQDGYSIRWTFNDIRANTFVWRGESRQSEGTWRLDAEFRLKRIL